VASILIKLTRDLRHRHYRGDPIGEGRGIVWSPLIIYCAIVYQDVFYAMNDSGYQAWNGNPASLPALESTIFASIENISIAEQPTQPSGEFTIYIAYDTNDGVLR